MSITNYNIQGILGHGSHGEVYLGRNTGDGKVSENTSYSDGAQGEGYRPISQGYIWVMDNPGWAKYRPTNILKVASTEPNC